jgi:hypothetical protein
LAIKIKTMKNIFTEKEINERAKINLMAWKNEGNFAIEKEGMNAVEVFIKNEIENYKEYLDKIGKPVFKTIGAAKKLTKISYIGKSDNSAKTEKGRKYNYNTFIVYLAAANQSGVEVCPMRSKGCTQACLMDSGYSKIEKYSLNARTNEKGEVSIKDLIRFTSIKVARIRRTLLYDKYKEFYTDWLIAEIEKAKKKSLEKGYYFCVRLNGTSDISPLSFWTTKNGKKENILEALPDIKFYDYTKVFNRTELAKKYKNYDITYSYSGDNKKEAISALENNINVAVVFGAETKNKMPKKWTFPDTGKTFDVIDGDETDLRFLDKKGKIVGLYYKTSAKELDENSEFVQKISGVNDGNCGCGIFGKIEYIKKPSSKLKNKAKRVQSGIAGEVVPTKKKHHWPFIGWE